MARYSSRPTRVEQPAEVLAAKFADFTTMQTAIDAMSAEQREKIGPVTFTTDTICISTPQVGDITLRAVERTPERMRLTAEGSPVPLEMIIDVKPLDNASCEVTGAIEVDIPMMLKPMVGPTLQKVADQFGGLFASLV